MEESLSLEETNKIRIKLGLKPLTDDRTPADTAEQTAERNYADRREEEKKAAEKKYVLIIALVVCTNWTCLHCRRIQDSIAK